MTIERLTQLNEGTLSNSQDAVVSTSYLDNETVKGNIFSAFFVDSFTIGIAIGEYS